MNVHLLRVADGAETYAELFAAAATLGLRVGWLELADAAPAPVPAGLAAAAGLGALRAVEIGPGGSVAVKPLRGAPVLKDVLREHFRGCALVLVRGDLDLPALERAGDGWRVRLDDQARSFDTPGLAAVLRSPRAFAFES